MEDDSEVIDVRALAKKRYETYLLQKRAHEELERLGIGSNSEDSSSKSSSSSSSSNQKQYQQSQQDNYQQQQQHRQQQNYSNSSDSSLDKQSILTELTMKITERFLKEQQLHKQEKKNAGSSSGNTNLQNGLELKISKEIENCTCPICYELMVPPNNQPMIIFPCGHTFCKLCLIPKNKSEKLTKCPFCRKPFSSHAPNIHLQNIICAYTDTKHLLDEEEQSVAAAAAAAASNQQKGGHQQFHSSAQKENADKNGNYAEDLKLYTLRCTILEQEKAEIVSHQNKAKESMNTHSSVVNSLSKQKIQVQQQLLKLQQELLLLDQFINENQVGVDKYQEIISADAQKLALIDQTLLPLQQERQKYSVLASHKQ